MLSCCLKLADVVDLKSQCVQLNVLSFMWMLLCCLKLADVVDLKSQCVQLNVLSFMWMLSCCLKLADVVDLLSNCAQLNGLKKCLICPLLDACSEELIEVKNSEQHQIIIF